MYSTIVSQRRLPSASIIICGPHSDWLLFLSTSQKKKSIYWLSKYEDATAEMTWDFNLEQRTMTSVFLLRVERKRWSSAFPCRLSAPAHDLHLVFHASSRRAHIRYIPRHLYRSHLFIICQNTDVSIVFYDEWVSVLSPFILPPCCVPLLTE